MVFSQKNRYIILIIFIGLVIRLINLNTYSVWLDEKTSVSEANSLIVFNFDSVFTLREIQNNDTLINVFRSVKIADAGNGRHAVDRGTGRCRDDSRRRGWTGHAHRDSRPEHTARDH